jgi:hypothetical protein
MKDRVRYVAPYVLPEEFREETTGTDQGTIHIA